MSHAEEKERTLGDGMDNTLMALSDSTSKTMGLELKLSSSHALLNSFKPVEPHGPITYLVPKYFPKERKRPKYLTRKPKEPKFIAYEPFKGAVARIVPAKKVIRRAPASKNNIHIHDLVVQMSAMRMEEMNKVKIKALEMEEFISTKQWEREKRAYETDIKNLRETNAHLENQLKFQAQVNSELKTLLVAAVGEDLESRVQHLTEDKLQLARALLNSANHLTSHQEQTEWLSGQCEVWRSKFLASSLMVEELARWKSVLAKGISELRQNLKTLLDERTTIRNYLLKCFNYLSQLNETVCNQETTPLKSSSVMELSLVNYEVSEVVANQVLKGNVNRNVESISKLAEHTSAELTAIQILRNPVALSSKPDALCNAVVGAALSLGAGQLYLQHPLPHATCCAHCKGEVQEI